MKILAVNGKKTEKIHDSFGDHELYPNYTERIVKKYKLFKGWKVYLETCSINYSCGDDGTIYYNSWEKVKEITNGEENTLILNWKRS